jgi:predicted GH43/DUF377 family glycosyl hydrolase
MDKDKLKNELNEWKDVGKKVEDLIKREINQLSKSGEIKNWKETGKNIEARIRSQMAKATNAHPESDWVEIGKHTEDRVRIAISAWAGADKNDDWAVIGKKFESKVKTQFAGMVGADQESDWIDIGKQIGDKVKSKVSNWLESDEKKQKEELDLISEPYRNWFYYPDFVIEPSPRDGLNFSSVDCPLVWKLGDEWQMWYTGFDGRGYQTALAVSKDLVKWESRGLVMGYGKEGAFDYGGVTFGGALFESYDIKAPRTLKKWNDKYWVLYGCYPKQGGYEIRPGAQGVAWSNDAINWYRASEDHPSLSIKGASEWEKDCIYQPFLVEYEGKFWNFYNAANGSIEQIGLATSTDMLTWYRYPGNPIVRNRPNGYDESFCSDPKVFRDGDNWLMFYFGVGKGGAHIMFAYSVDLLNWKSHPEPLYKAGGNPSGLDRTYAHKISLVYNEQDDTFYMFYCAVGDKGRGIGLITSKAI